VAAHEIVGTKKTAVGFNAMPAVFWGLAEAKDTPFGLHKISVTDEDWRRGDRHERNPSEVYRAGRARQVPQGKRLLRP
jgi:hypothetical protein